MLQLVISRTLGTPQLGLYVLATNLAFLPAEVASEVVGAVAFPLYARLQGDARQITRAFQGIFIGTAVVLFPVCALIIALAPSLVQHILGLRWEGTIPLIRLLACASIVGLFGDAVVPMLKGLGQPYKVAVIELIQALLLVLPVWVLARHYGLVGATFAWLPAIAVAQIVSAVFIKRILFQPFAGLQAQVLAIVAASGASAVLAIGIDSLLAGFGGFVATVFLSMVTTAALLWTLERWFDLGLADDLVHVFPQITTLVGFSRNVWQKQTAFWLSRR